MPLTVDIECLKEPFLCSSFYCSKRVGMPVEYGVLLIFNHSNRDRVSEIAGLLGEEKNFFSLTFDYQKILDKVELSECIHIEDEAETRLLLKYVQNEIEPYQPGPFQPRKRILKAANLLEVFRKYFSHLVKMDNTVEVALEKIKFIDKEKNNIIQYQQSDHELLLQIINGYNYTVAPGEALVISGSAVDSRYQLVWLQEDKCKSLRYQDKRDLGPMIRSVHKPVLNIGVKDDHTPKAYKSNKTISNISHTINRGNFNFDEWNEWKKVELPAFYDGKYTYNVRDMFVDTRDDNLAWETKIDTIARSEMQNIATVENRVWAGVGKVSNRSATSFWIEVELPGFEKDANKADVRVTTPYSGHSGNAGFHLVPEKDTEVEIIKGSDWLAPLMLLHNVRSKDAIEKAPFWKLEDNAKWSFQGLHKNVKEMQIIAEDTLTWKTKGVTTKIDSSKMEIS